MFSTVAFVENCRPDAGKDVWGSHAALPHLDLLAKDPLAGLSSLGADKSFGTGQLKPCLAGPGYRLTKIVVFAGRNRISRLGFRTTYPSVHRDSDYLALSLA